MKKGRNEGTGLLARLTIGICTLIALSFGIIFLLVFFGFKAGKFAVLSLDQMVSPALGAVGSVAIEESKRSLIVLGEKFVRQKAMDVATQIEIFIRQHPKMTKEELTRHPLFREIALQKVGETGYTSLHDRRGMNYLHFDPEIAGRNLRELSGRFPAFWRIVERGLKGPTSGYCEWSSPDGKIEKGFLYLAHVKGTDLIVAATIGVNELSGPAAAVEQTIRGIEQRAIADYRQNVKVLFLFGLAILAALLATVYFWCRSLVGPLRYLSEVAERTSMGELHIPIKVKATGELMIIAESLERMRLSVKAALVRLQKKGLTREN